MTNDEVRELVDDPPGWEDLRREMEEFQEECVPSEEDDEMKKTKEEQLQDLVQELYREHDRIVTPLYPKVFIRVLPKELTYGSLILPDDQQNKTQWEGVVLSVWESFWRTLTDTTESAFRKDRVVITTENHKRVLIEPQLKVGDHIVFPYHVGLPDPVFDAKKYRIISENDVSAVLTYEQRTIEDTLDDLLAEHSGVYDNPAVAVMENFDLVRKNVQCRTRSGV